MDETSYLPAVTEPATVEVTKRTAALAQLDAERVTTDGYERAKNTEKAYASTERMLTAFAEAFELDSASVDTAERFLSGLYFETESKPGSKPATIARHAAAIVNLRNWKHAPEGEKVWAHVAKIRRRAAAEGRSTPKRAHALKPSEVEAMLEHAGDGTRGARDRALVALGFALGWRRSELATLRVEDVELASDGALVTLTGPTKSDQTGEAGRVVFVPMSRKLSTCPARLVQRWISAAGVEDGPLFRRVDRHGSVLKRGLTGEGIGRTIASLAETAGVTGGLPGRSSVTGHSLRAGFVSEAKRRGAPDHHVMASTGHKTSAMLAVYARESNARDAAVRVL